MMTREEALTEKGDEYLEEGGVNCLVNAIYDDFESRTCSNCKYWNEFDRCEAGVTPINEVINGFNVCISDEFYCSKWESKDG